MPSLLTLSMMNPSQLAQLAPWRTRQVQSPGPLDTRPPTEGKVGMFWGGTEDAQAFVVSVTLSNCTSDEDLYPRFQRLPLTYLDSPASPLYHYADLEGALACFQLANQLAHDTAQIAHLDANDPTDDSHEGRLWCLRQWDFLASIVYWYAAGCNLLNIPWYLDPQSRAIYRKYFAGPNITPSRAYAPQPDSDYNPWGWFRHDDPAEGSSRDALYNPAQQRPSIRPPADWEVSHRNAMGLLPIRALELMRKWDMGGSGYADRILFRQQVGVILRPESGTHDDGGWKLPWYDQVVLNEGYCVPRAHGWFGSSFDNARIDDPTGQNRASADGRKWRSRSGEMKPLALFAVGQGFILSDPGSLAWIDPWVWDPTNIRGRVLDYKLPSPLMRRWWNNGKPLFDDGVFVFGDWRVTTGDFGLGENLSIPIRDYLPWLQELTAAMVSRQMPEIIMQSRRFSADENAAKVHAQGGMSNFLQSAGSTPEQVQQQWQMPDPAVAAGLGTASAVSLAAGASLASATFGISALVGGVLSAIFTIGNAVGNHRNKIGDVSMDDLGRWKPIAERAMLAGDWTLPNEPMSDTFRYLALPPGFCRATARGLLDSAKTPMGVWSFAQGTVGVLASRASRPSHAVAPVSRTSKFLWGALVFAGLAAGAALGTMDSEG